MAAKQISMTLREQSDGAINIDIRVPAAGVNGSHKALLDAASHMVANLRKPLFQRSCVPRCGRVWLLTRLPNGEEARLELKAAD